MLKKSTLKKGLSIAVAVVFALILVFNVTTAILSATDLRTRLGWLPYAAVSVQGGSMGEEMQSGDLIIVGKFSYDALQIGDDVTFMTQHGLVTHRIVEERDGEYVTKGLVNHVEDTLTMDAEAYCGRVVATLPLLGYVVQLLSSAYWAAALCLFLLLLLCFGRPIFCMLRAIAQNRKETKAPALATRVLACAGLFSMLFGMPYVTDTKYIAQINRFELAVAQPLYFTSNYLDEGDGNRYSILGWNGKAYNFNLQLRNYSNELLFNEEDVDIRYGIGTKIYTDGGYSADYAVEIKAPDGVTALGDFVYPEGWGAEPGEITPRMAYQLDGGEKTRQDFSVTVRPSTEDNTLAEGTKIYFEIYATTEIGKDYAIQMLGRFEMTVAASMDFIGENNQNILDSMVTVNIKTNLINEGVAEKVVLFSWNPEVMYLNEYESMVFNIINNDKKGEYFDKGNGYLWMKVQAFANLNLEFFKRDVSLDLDGDGNPDPIPDSYYRVSVNVVESVGVVPETETETEAEQEPEQNP